MPSTSTAQPALVRLLDVEPELAAHLRDDDRAEARERLKLATVDLPAGGWSLTAADRRTHPFGLIVLDGLLIQEVRIGGRRSQQLLGRGDVVLPRAPSDTVLGLAVGLVAAAPSRVALLDDRLQAPFALWPGLAVGLLERVGRQLTRAAAHAAIQQLPRVEDRLEATFWDLAERWGRVTPSGVLVPLRLTHEALARMVGGRRPTISLALASLGDRGILRRAADGTWVVVASAPSLSAPDADDDDADAAPLGVLMPGDPSLAPAGAPGSGGDRGPDASAPRRDAWPPAVRAELIATAQRAGAEHARLRERLAVNRARYEETRRRTRALREATAREREARERQRPLRTLSRRGPAAPSAG
ncbi:MAG TPA: Crp/Fnr family transcriptional regulator [Baekduia sp.]